MLKENLVTLRKLKGFSQEEIAEKIPVSRQAYAKWESGETVPDVEKCARLAEVYGVTVDSLLRHAEVDGHAVPPAPRGKHIFGTVVVGERGQLVIPKEARDVYKLHGGSRLVVLGDEVGIALVEVEKLEEQMRLVMERAVAPAQEG